jgi:hypothetical protein
MLARVEIQFESNFGFHRYSRCTKQKTDNKFKFMYFLDGENKKTAIRQPIVDSEISSDGRLQI